MLDIAALNQASDVVNYTCIVVVAYSVDALDVLKV